jgi:hypothetical protein
MIPRSQRSSSDPPAVERELDGGSISRRAALTQLGAAFIGAPGLIRRHYSDADIARVLGGNAVRAQSAIWQSA